jgi:hypothetical protein
MANPAIAEGRGEPMDIQSKERARDYLAADIFVTAARLGGDAAIGRLPPETLKWKDYRIKGRDRLKIMTLDAAEFIRRFLMHVLPSGFHRIRHYGLFAGTVRAHNIERARQLLAALQASPQRKPAKADSDAEAPLPARRCPCCGGRMIIIETFEGARPARSSSPSRIRIDTS